ncbi:AraC family transcriptional regulator [Bacillus sp. RG28]|uniref:AraC family transcriptional regulator n=1 Tax=Gottfriedia endophytica TaxID=2820819 RepID=A0A940SFH0_9BACI|nr:GyrI-like domain-containing protein [Gottfriedia endophytica]MBP0723992.1 AraC family transcriptional regulator [Gottfriedia endophytica]
MSNVINISTAIKLEGFNFVGSSSRTSNNAEMQGEGVIPTQWENFYKKQVLQTIPNKKNSSLIALYTNYDSDENGEYTFGIGAEVIECDVIPEGLVKIDLPESSYIIFTSRKGPVQEVVVEAWQEIWEWSKNNKRAFTADFELYDERALDPQNSQVDIYISVN